MCGRMAVEEPKIPRTKVAERKLILGEILILALYSTSTMMLNARFGEEGIFGGENVIKQATRERLSLFPCIISSPFHVIFMVHNKKKVENHTRISWR